MNLLDYVIDKTEEYIGRMPKDVRKEYGQFFTSKETAVFMASLFEFKPDEPVLHVLDAGAGSGVLAVALLERLQAESIVEMVYLTCYENDPLIIELLRENLTWVASNASLKLEFRIRSENYILSQMDDFNQSALACPQPTKYNLVIGNPPYKKIGKDAPEAKAMPTVCYGAPNLYFLFASMGLFNLASDGQMVYIMPRSWTSGAYFKAFREYLFTWASIEHIHLFVSRDKVFDKEKVLQETMIIKLRKTERAPKTITMTTTKSNQSFSDLTTYEAPYHLVVSNKDYYVYLVTNSEEALVVNRMRRWNETLLTLGLRMKTGLTVDFRHREALLNEALDHAVPLFYPQHIKSGRVEFPLGIDHEYIITDRQGLLQSNTNLLFVKRFTSKEERRRLQCGVYLSKDYPAYDRISTQNKINFIDSPKGLSECMVYGLYVLFNSSLYDSYYRILNGSTQVNSTEVNAMPVPPMSTIKAMGKRLMQTADMSEEACDSIMEIYSEQAS